MNETGKRDMARTYYSERQRLVVLSFATPGEAQRWDEAGQPFYVGEEVPMKVIVGLVEDGQGRTDDRRD